NSAMIQALIQASDSQSSETGYIHNRLDGTLELYATAPLLGAREGLNNDPSSSELLGYLVVTIDTEFLTQLIQEMPIGLKGGLLLSDGQGSIIATSEDLDISQLGFGQLQSKPELPYAITSRQDNPAAHIPQLVTLNDENYYVGSNRLSNNLFAHVIVPEHELLLLGSDISILIGLVTTVAIFVAVPLLILMLRKQILIPVERLNHAFNQLGEGEGDSVVEVEALYDDELGELSQAFNVMSQDLSQSNAKIRVLAYKDPLTGLPNRHMFGLTLENIMEECKTEDCSLALLFLDLDDFKNVNDTLGHQAGDKILKQTGTILEQNLREDDYIGLANPVIYNSIARLGGDEFIILLPGISNRAEIDRVAERIITAMNKPIFVDGHEFNIGASIGITIYPEDGLSAEDLIKNADMAMYEAKKQGKRRFHYFSESIGSDQLARVKLRQKLHKAVEQGAFELYYQPQVDSVSERIVSVEALIRWPDEEQGMISPEKFIPIAEETGLIIPIGEWVLERACKQLKSWHDQGLPDIRVAVNVSGVQLNKANILTQVDNALRSSRISPEHLHLELTESAILSGRELAVKLLDTFRSQGISIALDDFGTGYSSLSYLRTLPIDILKVDRSFIQEIHHEQSAPILSSIISMAHALNIRVVAEGVEEQTQVEFMRMKQCDIIQGYYYSRPVSAEQLGKILALENDHSSAALPSQQQL
ncbi:MAG: EAL domain-containing protein, partial [Motiliproteus sp.]|nr:EAL domain-containing protein [Motiliproteus sp.]